CAPPIGPHRTACLAIVTPIDNPGVRWKTGGCNMSVCYAAACALLVLTGVSRAQSSEPRDAWLMQNYRFTGPPPATGITAVDPVVSELREIQNTLLAILRKANF